MDKRVDLEPRRGKGGQLCAVRRITPAERKSHARFLWESGSGDESASAELQEILSNLNLLVLKLPPDVLRGKLNEPSLPAETEISKSFSISTFV